MTGKDLLAVLAMIAPGILLIALIAITLVPPSVMQPFPGSGGLSKGSRAQPPVAPKTLVLPEEPTGAGLPVATQKRLRNPWEPLPYAKSAKASRRESAAFE